MGGVHQSPYAEGDEDTVLSMVAEVTRTPALAARAPRPAARVGVLGEWWRRASVRDVLGAMNTSLHDADAQSSGCAALTGLATDPSRCATLQGSTAAGVVSAVLDAMGKHAPTPHVQTAACICVAVLAMDTAHRESLLAADGAEQLMAALQKHPLDAEVQQYAMAGLAMLLVENHGASARVKARGAERLVSKALGRKHWGAQGRFDGHDEIQRFGNWLLRVFGAIAEPEPEPEPEPQPEPESPGAAEREAVALMAARREKLARQQDQQQAAAEQRSRQELGSPGPRKTQPESRSLGRDRPAPIAHYLDTLPFQKAQASSDGVERNLMAKDREHAQAYLDQLHGTAVNKAASAGPSPEARRRYARVREASPPKPKALFSPRDEVSCCAEACATPDAAVSHLCCISQRFFGIAHILNAPHVIGRRAAGGPNTCHRLRPCYPTAQVPAACLRVAWQDQRRRCQEAEQVEHRPGGSRKRRSGSTSISD
jgi:hypothetical protein